MSRTRAVPTAPRASANRASGLLAPRRRLDGPELAGVVGELAARAELWRDLVAHDPSRRVYNELVRNDHLAAWLICWMDDQSTGFHDHDSSAGAVAVVSGHVLEERLRLGREPARRVFGVGERFHFAAADIHSVRHDGAEPAVTLHAYSPPLERMGAYVVESDGRLVRHAVPYTEELRPLASV